jgi:hypothetical protein
MIDHCVEKGTVQKDLMIREGDNICKYIKMLYIIEGVFVEVLTAPVGELFLSQVENQEFVVIIDDV